MKYEWKNGDELVHEDGELGVFHKPMSQNALESCGWRLNAPSKPYSSSHYTSKREGLEAIDVIEAFDLNRNLANVCKYILRCNHKGQRDSDLEKAINYLWRERYGTWLPKFENAATEPPDKCPVPWCGMTGTGHYNACGYNDTPCFTTYDEFNHPNGHYCSEKCRSAAKDK